MRPTVLEDAKLIGIDVERLTEDVDLEKLEDSSHMLDVLLQLENVLDSMDTYVGLHWIEGEVVKGPIVRRHWISFSLLYPLDKMPDPRVALRLLKVGVQVEFNKIKKQEAGTVNHPPSEPQTASYWLVTITVPRRLLAQTEEADLADDYDEEVNPDDIEAAKDIGLDNESTLNQDEQAPDSTTLDNGQPEEPPPGGQPPPR